MAIGIRDLREVESAPPDLAKKPSRFETQGNSQHLHLPPTHLHVALDEVERRDGHVGEPAAGDPSGRAGGVERRRVHLDLLPGRLDREGRAACYSSRGRRRGGDGEARGAAGEGARRGGVEEAREERLAGAVGERHRRRETRRARRLSRGLLVGAF